MSANAMVDAKIRGMRTYSLLSLICLVLACCILAYYAWFYDQMIGLGRQYGWGNIPVAAFPINPMEIEHVFAMADYAMITVFVLGSILFLAVMGYARSAVTAMPGHGDFYYSWGWTLGSLLIPFWLLYRPWVGFAEIRRAVFGIANRGQVTYEWKNDGFSGGTLLLGLVFIISLGAIKGFADRADSVAMAGTVGLPQIEQLSSLIVAQLIARVAYLTGLGWYMLSLYGKVKALATVAPAIFNVPDASSEEIEAAERHPDTFMKGEHAGTDLMTVINGFLDERIPQVSARLLSVPDGRLKTIHDVPDYDPATVARSEFRVFMEHASDFDQKLLAEVAGARKDWLDLADKIGLREMVEGYVASRLKDAKLILMLDAVDKAGSVIIALGGDASDLRAQARQVGAS